MARPRRTPPRRGAARPEPAARGGVDRRGQLPAHGHLPAPSVLGNLGHGDGLEQPQRVRVDGPGVHRAGGADLDQLAQVHHPDGVRHVADDGEVVGDHDQGETPLVLEVLHQIEDLRLDRHVEGRHRLVGHDDLGLEGEGTGESDALALPARELVRVPAGSRRVEPDLAQQRWRHLRLLARRRRPTPWTLSGSRMIVPTRMRGSREA